MARQRYQEGVCSTRQATQGVGRSVEGARVARGGSAGSAIRGTRTVVDLPTRRRADAARRTSRADQPGTSSSAVGRSFGEFAEREWKTLVLPTFKLSTQQGYRMMLQKHLVPYWREWRLCDIGRLDVQQWVAEVRQQLAWQTVRNAWIVLSSILDAAMEYGELVDESGAGRQVPAGGATDGAGDHRPRGRRGAAEAGRRTASHDDRVDRRDGVANRGAAGAAVARSRPRRRHPPGARVSVRGHSASRPRRSGRCGRFR